MRKLILCVLSTMFFTVAPVAAQELMPDSIGDLPNYFDDDEEIGNYDFLYTNGGDNLNFDEVMTENLIEEAISHLGARYVYGSKGPYTFDCSGFTSYVYKQQTGIFIGSCSREQYAQNMPIKREELQCGDLVFFTSPRSGKNVGHVGIVVEVDPKTHQFSFIHASSSNGVKVSKSTESNYARRYVGCRRVNRDVAEK